MEHTINSQFQDHLECVSLKSLLTRDLQSLGRLIHSLCNQAEEAARETHPDLEASKRFRRAFAASCNEYLSSAAQTSEDGQNDGSAIYNAVYSLIRDFQRDVKDLLPMAIRNMETQGSTEYNWNPHFEGASKRALQLVKELEPHLHSLRAVQQKKQQVHQSILEVNGELRKTLL